MAGTESNWRQRTVWTRTSAIVLLLVFCMGTVASMAWLVLREIDELSTANSDNLQWSLAQADVEFLKFELAVNEALRNPENLREVRRRFDIFYSRMRTLQRGEVFQALRSEPEFEQSRQGIESFLSTSVSQIDGTDQALVDDLPAMASAAKQVAADVRQISLSGLAAFAKLSDQRREEVVQSLVRVSIVLAVLLGGLSLLAYSFNRLYRSAEQNALAAQRASTRSRTVVEAAADAIIVCDDDGHVVEMNAASQNLFGYSRDETFGRPALELFQPPSVRGAVLDRLIKATEDSENPEAHQRQVETIAVDRAGREFPVEISMAKAEAAGERVFVAHIRDISNRKAAEKGLTEARDRALAGEKAKAEFLALMSHEMRTPLNGLLGTMDLLRDHKLTERQTDLLDHMQSSGHLLLGLVNDVLDLSKFEAGKQRAETRPFDITRLLDGVVETTMSLAAASGNSVAWSWQGEPDAQVLGDSRRLRQVLLNLVSNAIKFTRAGSIDIEVERLPGQEDLVEFRVIDTGIGIAPENLARIFKDFETLDSSYARRAGGTGLGLGISKRFVGLMGGEIGVESEPGEGSMFWLRVPLPVEEQASSDTTKSAKKTPDADGVARPLSILLVEDNEINRFVARAMIEAEGHSVTEAVNGKAGVEWAQAQEFDVILMDISMPVMDGQEAARAIRAGNGASANSPIVAVTAHALPEEIAGFKAAGMKHCISKPIDRKALLGLLNELAIRTGHPEPDPTAQEALLLDTNILNELRDTLGATQTARLIGKCINELDTSIQELSETATDDEALGATAHKCAGSCSSFGMVAMRRALGRIETQAANGSVKRQDLQALASVWEDSKLALQDWEATGETVSRLTRPA